ncbi:hypothetical protein PAXINDRAFT_157871 [Paxillus involutus ATCC 200175]|uniref:Uncharacterized protein n=1 Tax=Paxillus involutus ATCC 200175 TaxID=664439 RepID=A0A0C9T1B2_PAXIN|nr:hypothetical protein PAXINDRAFT_157871 [Paxillus involutus ATCC 200175]
MAFPKTFLLQGMTPEAANHLLTGHIWSSKDVTFETSPFPPLTHPKHILSVIAPNSIPPDEVLKAIRNTWLSPDSLSYMRTILKHPEVGTTEIEQTFLTFSTSINVEHFIYNPTGPRPRILLNVLATIEMPTADIWASIKAYLRTLDLQVKGGSEPLKHTTALTCTICHAIAHTAPIRPFMAIPAWNGPKYQTRTPTPTKHSPVNLEHEELLREKEMEELKTLHQNESIYG